LCREGEESCRLELDLDLVAVRQRLLVHAIRGFVPLFTVFQLSTRARMK
jgi:hypothetical protein